MSHLNAVTYARWAHRDHRRRYTGAPYDEHLAEVAALVLSTGPVDPDLSGSVAWLHDTVEDCGVTVADLHALFGPHIAEGVRLLTDCEEGNRAARKALARERLAGAPGWVQTIKVADLCSNTRSIVEHDPKFARLYLVEARALLDVLVLADGGLRELLRGLL